MRKAYYKNGVEVARPKQLYMNNCTYIPPTDEQLLEAGYEIKDVEEDIFDVSYETRVVELIRLRYTPDQEYAILRQRDRKPEEFAEYDAYCEECKLQAKEGL